MSSTQVFLPTIIYHSWAPILKKSDGSEVVIGPTDWINFTYEGKSMTGKIFNTQENHDKKEIEYILVEIWNGIDFLREMVKILPNDFKTLNTFKSIKPPDFFLNYWSLKPIPKFINGDVVQYIFDQKTKKWVLPTNISKAPNTGCIISPVTGNLIQTGPTTYKINFNMVEKTNSAGPDSSSKRKSRNSRKTRKH
jgi:hypothetical protein